MIIAQRLVGPYRSVSLAKLLSRRGLQQCKEDLRRSFIVSLSAVCPRRIPAAGMLIIR